VRNFEHTDFGDSPKGGQHVNRSVQLSPQTATRRPVVIVVANDDRYVRDHQASGNVEAAGPVAAVEPAVDLPEEDGDFDPVRFDIFLEFAVEMGVLALSVGVGPEGTEPVLPTTATEISEGDGSDTVGEGVNDAAVDTRRALAFFSSSIAFSWAKARFEAASPSRPSAP